MAELRGDLDLGGARWLVIRYGLQYQIVIRPRVRGGGTVGRPSGDSGEGLPRARPAGGELETPRLPPPEPPLMVRRAHHERVVTGGPCHPEAKGLQVAPRCFAQRDGRPGLHHDEAFALALARASRKACGSSSEATSRLQDKGRSIHTQRRLRKRILTRFL